MSREGNEELGTATEAGLSRRSALKRVGIGAAVVWSAPALLSMNSPAFAASANPHPECVGSACDAFIVCNTAGPDCICTQIYGGGGFCIDGHTSCLSGSGACGPGGACQPGEVCLTNTCCGGDFCIPVAAGGTCPATAGAGSTATRILGGPGTLGG